MDDRQTDNMYIGSADTHIFPSSVGSGDPGPTIPCKHTEPSGAGF